MATTGTGRIQVGLNATLTKTHDGGNVVQAISDGIADALTSGSGALQFNQAYSDAGQVTAAGSPVSIDLIGTANTDGFKDDLDIQRIVGLYIENLSSSTGVLLVGAGAACVVNFTDAIKLPIDSGMLFWFRSTAAVPVTATTADILQLDAATGVCDYVIHILGS